MSGKKTERWCMTVLLALFLAVTGFGMSPGVKAYAETQDDVSYQEASWDEPNEKVKYETKTAGSCTEVTDTDTAWGSEDNTAWYVVSQNMTLSGRITVAGTVNLILSDGATLTAGNGITTTDATLNIYAQEAGTGQLVAETDDSSSAAAIGGKENEAGGTISIHGGKVTASSNGSGAGIGGGKYGNGGSVTVYGGSVTATNDGQGAGIGGGTSCIMD
ncbi:MAG: hypothetical protein K6A69_06920, partial [Lachnospiraceae bacterium]|nr:hypothetical protein [Lachnospiraceae bacterium]